MEPAEQIKVHLPEAAILDEIFKELRRGKKKFPNFPDHPAAQAAIVSKDAGSLIDACLNWKYQRAPVDSRAYDEQKRAMKVEAIKVAAMAIRFIENLK